jgi:hypothetical protein
MLFPDSSETSAYLLHNVISHKIELCIVELYTENERNVLTNFMELSPSLEAASCTAVQELPSNSWNLMVYYHAHKGPPWDIILSQINSVHTIPILSLRYILILSIHLCLGLSSGPFSCGVTTNILYTSLFPHSCYVPCRTHAPWFDHSNYTWRKFQVMKLLVMQILTTSRHFRHNRREWNKCGHVACMGEMKCIQSVSEKTYKE